MTELRPVRGWIPPKRWPSPEELAVHQFRMARAAAVESFAPTTLGTPTILDQINTSACFGFAAVQAVHIVTGAPIGSPLVPYWFARREAAQSDADVTDEGSDPDSMIAALNDFGSCPMADDPFSEAKINERPGDVATLAAQRTRCTVEPLIATGAALWTAIQHAICIERLPVLIAIDVVPGFDNAGKNGGVVDDPSGTIRGGHANCLFAVEANGARTANSWGVGPWTADGTAILTPRFLGARVLWAGALRVQP